MIESEKEMGASHNNGVNVVINTVALDGREDEKVEIILKRFDGEVN